MTEHITLTFDDNGLLPAIVQDEATGDVLMLAYMNREAVEKTLQTGRTWFYSRSRRSMWMKGESSGHTQEVKAVLYDCDADTLLVRVVQTGAACHMGYRSCFFRKLNPDGTAEVVAERAFNPEDVYGKKE